MSKYGNHKIIGVASIYDENAAKFIYAFNKAISLTDDILDRQISSSNVLELFYTMYQAMQFACKDPALIEHINSCVLEMIKAEEVNLSYIPGAKSNAEELEIWLSRGMVIRLMFEVLCYVDRTFDTPDNREWLTEYVLECGKFNDCKDILCDRWEDFYQCRRNFVALTYFDSGIYQDWRDRKSELIDVAKGVMAEVKFPEPKDKRLLMCKGGQDD